MVIMHRRTVRQSGSVASTAPTAQEYPREYPGAHAGDTRYAGEPYPTTRRETLVTEEHYDEEDSRRIWEGRSRVVLLPTAAPSILGLFGFAGATLMVGAWQAGWYGNASTGMVIAPFCFFFGGLAQFLAGMWSYRARDGLATAMHGMWGAFWLAFGVLFLLNATGTITLATFGQQSVPFGMWFVVLGAITLAGTFAALAVNLGLTGVLGTLAAGSSLTAVGWIVPSLNVLRAGGVLFVISAGIAIYVAWAMMMKESFGGRTIMPLGEWNKAGNIPTRMATYPLEYPQGMPGAKVGQ